MRIVLITQWFPPEQAPIGYMIKELAEELAAAGHEVHVITGFPNHPSGVIFGGYEKRWNLQERLGDVNITRVWLATSANRSALRRILTFFTFTLTSAWALLRQPKTELVFAVFQPLSVGVTLPTLVRLKGAKLVLNVQDLHPDVPIELGLIRSPVLIGLLRFIEAWGYKRASALSVICEAFKDHCVARGARRQAIEVIPNWIDLDEIRPGDRNNRFRTSLGLNDQHFVVLLAGTLGWVSGAEVLLHAAHRLRDLSDIRVVVVGEGPLLAGMRGLAASLGLSNVIFAPFQLRTMLSSVQATSDVSVVSLHKGKGRASVPSKVLGYMAAARPVVASVDVDSETACTILQANCGIVVEPENAEKLAHAIRTYYVDRILKKQHGINGRDFLENNYSKSIITKKYIDFFERVAE